MTTDELDELAEGVALHDGTASPGPLPEGERRLAVPLRLGRGPGEGRSVAYFFRGVTMNIRSISSRGRLVVDPVEMPHTPRSPHL